MERLVCSLCCDNQTAAKVQFICHLGNKSTVTFIALGAYVFRAALHVEIGQLLALGGILILMGYWRRTASFWRHAYTANVAMMSAGFLLMGYQITGLIVSQ